MEDLAVVYPETSNKQYGLVPNTNYCRSVVPKHPICGASPSSPVHCATTLPNINWSIDEVSCGKNLSGDGSSGNPYVASGDIMIPDGSGYVAYNTTNTAGSSVICRFQGDSGNDLTPTGVNSGSYIDTFTEDTWLKFICSDNFGNSTPRTVFCNTSKACLIEDGCLDCSFEPVNSPMAPVVGEVVTFTANINGGTAPYTIVWSGDDVNFTKSGISDAGKTQQLLHVYSTTGKKSVTATVTDSDSHTATCKRDMDPEIGIKGIYKEL